jgi:hypothetical protein
MSLALFKNFDMAEPEPDHRGCRAHSYQECSSAIPSSFGGPNARLWMFAAIWTGFDQNQCERSVGPQNFQRSVVSFGSLPMIRFTYRCPRTGQHVQGWAADNLTEGETYEPLTCTACGRIHLVNPKSGKVLESAKK